MAYGAKDLTMFISSREGKRKRQNRWRDRCLRRSRVLGVGGGKIKGEERFAGSREGMFHLYNQRCGFGRKKGAQEAKCCWERSSVITGGSRLGGKEEGSGEVHAPFNKQDK